MALSRKKKKTVFDRVAWFGRVMMETGNADLTSSIIHSVETIQQLRPYSCTAHCLQMLVQFFGGWKMTVDQAVDLMDCKPHGASLPEIVEVLDALKIKVQAKTIDNDHTLIKAAIRRGCVLIACDYSSHEHHHAVLVVGYNNDGFWVNDPLLGFLNHPTFRTFEMFDKSINECIAVRKPSKAVARK